MAEKLSMAVSSDDQVSSLIMTLRATPVLMDTDLAALYGVTTKALNQAVQLNAERFPPGFKFQLNLEEKNELVTNCGQFNKLKHSSALPHAFTEQGVAFFFCFAQQDCYPNQHFHHERTRRHAAVHSSQRVFAATHGRS